MELECGPAQPYLSLIKRENIMLSLGLSVPGEIPRCSASTLPLLAGFLNSAYMCVCVCVCVCVYVCLLKKLLLTMVIFISMERYPKS